MLFLGSSTFFMFGIVLVVLGVHQAELARDLALDLADTGLLGAVLALGLGGGVLAAGPLADRFARGPLFVAACAVTAAALFGIGEAQSFGVLVVLLVFAGFGCGFYDTVINAAIVDNFRERTASALALVHSAATFGACVGPALIAWANSGGPWGRTFHALGAAHCALALWGAFSGLGTGTPKRAAAVRIRAAEWVSSPALIALSVVAFAYVGAENGLTLFAVPWALSRAEAESAGQWSISTFWLGLLVGRLALAARPTRRGLVLLAVAGLSSGVVLSVTNAVVLGPLAVATAVAGLALGPTYPLLIVLAAERFPAAAGTAVGLVAGAGACGGFAVPWLIGVLGDSFGLRLALSLLALSTFLIAAAAVALLRSDAVPAPGRG